MNTVQDWRTIKGGETCQHAEDGDSGVFLPCFPSIHLVHYYKHEMNGNRRILSKYFLLIYFRVGVVTPYMASGRQCTRAGPGWVWGRYRGFLVNPHLSQPIGLCVLLGAQTYAHKTNAHKTNAHNTNGKRDICSQLFL